MANSVVQHRGSKEVLYPGPDPLGVCHNTHRGPGNHVNKSQHRQKEGRLLFGDVFTLCKITEKHQWSKETEEHDNIAHDVEQKATVLEQGEINEAVNNL